MNWKETSVGKKKLFQSLVSCLTSLYLKVHAGCDPDEVLKSHDELSKLDSVGLPVENALKIAKWLFIDEDIKYWGHGGRDKWKASLDDLATSSVST